MKEVVAANVSLVLAVVCVPLLAYGYSSVLGDPAPWVPASAIQSSRFWSATAFSVGLVCLFFSFWLSGYAFRSARWRSLLAVAICCVPVFYIANLWYAP